MLFCNLFLLFFFLSCGHFPIMTRKIHLIFNRCMNHDSTIFKIKRYSVFLTFFCSYKQCSNEHLYIHKRTQHTHMHTHMLCGWILRDEIAERECKFGFMITKMPCTEGLFRSTLCSKMPNDSYLPWVRAELCWAQHRGRCECGHWWGGNGGVISPAGCVWRRHWPLALPGWCVSQEEETWLCVLTFALPSRVWRSEARSQDVYVQVSGLGSVIDLGVCGPTALLSNPFLDPLGYIQARGSPGAWSFLWFRRGYIEGF